MIFEALLEKRASISQSGIHPSTDHLASWLGGSEAFSGVQVSESNAMTYSAVYAAVRVLSESLAQVPVKLYRRRSDGGKDLADGERIYNVVHDEPNRETTAFTFKETGQGLLSTWGNFYAEIEMNGRGEVLGLWQRRSDRVEVDRDSSGKIIYRVSRLNGGEDVVPRERMFHVPGLSFNGLVGFSPIRMARESIGLGLATERHGASLFGQGAWPGGVIEHPGKLTKEGQDRLRDSIEKAHKGSQRSGRTMVLDEAMSWKQAGLPSDEAQFLETRQFQVQDVARWFRIPPHMLADLSRATFSNIEEMSLEFVKYTLTPWFSRWESSMSQQLLTPSQREQGLFFEFVADGLLRGDFKTRMEGYAVGRQWGWLSANDIRRKENMDPIDGGDDYLVPLNMQSSDDPRPQPESGGQVDELPERSEARQIENRAERSLNNRWRIREAFERVLEDAAGRVVAREVQDIRGKLSLLEEGNVEEFRTWLNEYMERHRTFVRSALGGALVALMEAVAREAGEEVSLAEEEFEAQAEQFTSEYNEAMVTRHVRGRQNQIEALLSEEEPVEAIEERLASWSEGEAQKIARAESAQAMNAMTMTAYLAAGVRLVRWVWNGGDCKICPKMNGRVVEIGTPFVRPGERVGEDEEGFTPYVVKQIRKHPPLHRSCQCGLSTG